MIPNLFSIAMFPSVPIKDAGNLHRLLDLFENFKICPPTRWSNNEITSLEYDRNAISERALLNENRISEVYLYGKQGSISYSARFSLNVSFRSFLEIDCKRLPQTYWGDFFEFSDHIANIVKPRYGATHLFWPTAIPWQTERERLHSWMDFCAQPAPVHLGVNGPLGLAARTYFGTDILALLDDEILSQVNAKIVATQWNGIRIDVIPNPWSVDADELLNGWIHSMNAFDDAKLFAIPEFNNKSRRSVSFQPNEKWIAHLHK
ncbi:hypothetical protein [Paenibacillus wenxiniae]|uniref:DUF3396 domain-containing protein n=1 Tax=Paenibacillus wenxiniae TaxID=1636843 RepID=A0ABW4RG12_9BACL